MIMEERKPGGRNGPIWINGIYSKFVFHFLSRISAGKRGTFFSSTIHLFGKSKKRSFPDESLPPRKENVQVIIPIRGLLLSNATPFPPRPGGGKGARMMGKKANWFSPEANLLFPSTNLLWNWSSYIRLQCEPIYFCFRLRWWGNPFPRQRKCAFPGATEQLFLLLPNLEKFPPILLPRFLSMCGNGIPRKLCKLPVSFPPIRN